MEITPKIAKHADQLWNNMQDTITRYTHLKSCGISSLEQLEYYNHMTIEEIYDNDDKGLACDLIMSVMGY